MHRLREKEGATSGREAASAASAASSSTASPALGGDGDAAHGAAEDSHQQQQPIYSDEFVPLQNNMQQPNENESPSMGTGQAGGQHGGEVGELVDNRTTNPTNNADRGEEKAAAPSIGIQEDEWVNSVLEEWCGVEKREDGKQHAEDDSKPAATPSTAVPVGINGQDVDESRVAPSASGQDRFDVDAFLQEFSSQNDQQLQVLPLRRWIKRAKARAYYEADILLQSTSPVSEYVNVALPLALKLTAFLIEAEMEDGQIQVPQSSITAQNVVVQVKEHLAVGSTTSGAVMETIEDVWITSSSAVEDSQGARGEGVMSQLSALGVILYELFAGEEPPLSEDDLLTFDASSSNALSLNSVDLSNETNSNYRPQQKSQRQSLYTSDADEITQCTARLESKGIPWAL